MTTTRRPDPRTEALYELATAKPAPDAALLADLVRRNPDHAAELTAAAVELALEDAAARLDLAPEEPLAADDPLVLAAMRRLGASLDAHAVRAPSAPSATEAGEARPAPENPFYALDRTTGRALAARLHANTTLLIRLRDRLIAAETMTTGFVRRLADELGVTFEVMSAHLAGPAQLAPGASYKADRQPAVGAKQTFEEAIGSAGLSAEEQAYLRAL